jgi:nucleoside 2-deoxyribosyltransferase
MRTKIWRSIPTAPPSPLWGGAGGGGATKNEVQAMSDNDTCPIWGTPATLTHQVIKGTLLTDVSFSPRAGGVYCINDWAKGMLPHKDEQIKARLTTWLIGQRQLGPEWPVITEKVIELVEQRQPLPVHERADRLLRYIDLKTNVIGKAVTWYDEPPDSRYHSLVRDENIKKSLFEINDNASDFNLHKMYFSDPELPEMLAWSESISYDEVKYLLDYMTLSGWVVFDDSHQKVKYGLLTVRGYARLAELATKQINSSQGFVAMWFDDSMTEAYEKGIKPGIEDAGYKPLPINRKEHINKIDDEIIVEIRRSRFVVADFTHGDSGPRGGVYYEAGFAHGLNIPVFFTCREDVINQLHFDTRQYNHIKWKTPDDLRKQLADRISAVIGDGPMKLPKA